MKKKKKKKTRISIFFYFVSLVNCNYSLSRDNTTSIVLFRFSKSRNTILEIGAVKVLYMFSDLWIQDFLTILNLIFSFNFID
jgi:hypothetical protein